MAVRAEDTNNVAPSGTSRGEAEPAEARAALVKSWIDKVKKARKHWEKNFDRMREDMKFAKGLQWPDQDSLDDDRYVANIVKRHLHQRTSALYAKDPKAVAERREQMDFRVWDGDMQTLLAAFQQVQEAAQLQMDPQQLVPQAVALVQDFQEGSQRRAQLDKVAKTVEILFHYFLGEQRHGFKRQMKQVVRRTLTTGVGYVKLGFQRVYDKDPDVESRLEDVTEKLEHLRRLTADAQDGEIPDNEAEAEELELMIEQLQEEVEMIVREGLVFDFPAATAVIPDPNTRSIEGGFIGADWIAEEFIKTPDEIQEIYGVDLQGSFEKYNPEGKEKADAGQSTEDVRDETRVCMWEVYDRKSGFKYVIADGHKDFLMEPAPPYPPTDRFFPIYPLTFNTTEDEEDPYPVSDVRELRHIQREYNRSKEGLRQHRYANRPLYVGAAGALEEADQKSLAGHPAHAFIPLQGLQPGQNANEVLQPVGKIPIDPNLYEVSTLYTDILRVSGDQEANLGGTSGATATEVNVAESTRVSSLASNIDDMDELLTDISRDAGKVLLLEMSPEQVMEIAGPGAVWPTLNRQQLAEEVLLEIEAGSSGRPNRTQQIANFERVAPFIMQIPGISPQWLAEYVLKVLDDKLDLKEAVISGLPSIMAQNQTQQVGTGNAETDPNQQGPQGQQNQAQGQRGAPGAGGPPAPLG